MTKEPPVVFWSGPITDPSGYGEASRRYVMGLEKIGDPVVKVKPLYFWQGTPGVLSTDVVDTLRRVENRAIAPNRDFVFVQHSTPDAWQITPKAVAHVGVTTFETDRVPQQWLLNMRAMDEVFVFSKFNRDVFMAEGVKRVTVIPHGVDIQMFRPDAPMLPMMAELRKNFFLIGSNFDWSPRKNPEGLLKAYHAAFKRSDPVVLVLKTYYYPNTAEKSRAILTAAVQRLRESLKIPAAEAPRICILTQTLSDPELAGFYAGLDAYCLPSRGEGWSLTHSEAMATGLPTIGVNWSGNTEFMNRDNSMLVGYKIVEVAAEEAAQRPLYTGHCWAEANHNDLAHALRLTYDNPTGTRLLGLRAREDMRAKYTWGRACAVLAGRLREIGRSSVVSATVR